MLDDIMRLNGKQTIYQMIQLAERIQERGGEPREPLWYKHEYLRRLEAHIGARTAGLKSGAIAADQLLVHGARPLLKHLRDRGLHLYLASGTDESAVKQEAALLDITSDFGPHIYGALDDYKQFSKKMIIDRILARARHHGPPVARRSATATSRSKTPSRSAALRWPSPPTRLTTARGGSTSGSAGACWESAPMPSSPIFVTPSHSLIICWAAERAARPIGQDCEVSERERERDTTRFEQAQGLSPRRAQEPHAGRRDPDRARRSA